MSPSSKPTEPSQDSPLPKEPGSDSAKDKPTTASQASNEDDNDETTKEIKKLADEDNVESIEDEVD